MVNFGHCCQAPVTFPQDLVPGAMYPLPLLAMPLDHGCTVTRANQSASAERLLMITYITGWMSVQKTDSAQPWWDLAPIWLCSLCILFSTQVVSKLTLVMAPLFPHALLQQCHATDHTQDLLWSWEAKTVSVSQHLRTPCLIVWKGP